MNEKKVIYLTGAPASGKSTLIRGLERTFQDVKVFEYGRAMSEMLSESGRAVTQEELRTSTISIVRADIDALDARMISWVDRHRHRNHLIIDSHHVTIEGYGFRVEPFSQAKLAALRMTEFWLLLLDGSKTIQRIEQDPRGRRLPSVFEAEYHALMQSSLAAQYATLTGVPLYVFDSSLCEADLLANVSSRLR